MNAPSFATELGRQAAEEAKVVDLAPGETSLSFLQKIYHSTKQPMSRRMRAAIEALPFESPKLGAIAFGNMTGQDFAAMLDRAILRSQGNGRNIPQIELRAEPDDGR
jgi:hypothetical protein